VTRAELRAATVTLAELGVVLEPRTIADSLIEGFAATLDVSLTLDLDLQSSPRVLSTPRGG
jgi:hypothetical protein